MTTYEKTLRLARLIGLDYHASESKQRVWRQVPHPEHQYFRRVGAWRPWRPYECLANLEPLLRWLEKEHPAWLHSQPYECQAAYCDAVLAAFAPEPEPTTAYVVGVDVAAPGTESLSVQYELAEYHARIATERIELREHAEKAEAECKRLQADIAFYRGALERAKVTINDAIERAERAEAECKRLEAERTDLLALCENINHALWPDPDGSHDTVDAPAEIERLKASNAFLDGQNIVAEQEIEKLTSDLAGVVANCERLSRAVSPGEGVWVWQGDGGDHVESLVCQVLMQPKALLAILSERDDAKHGMELAESALAGEGQEIERVTATINRIADGAEWCGIVREGVAINVCLWNLPHCDGRKGSLLEAAEAAERGEG